MISVIDSRTGEEVASLMGDVRSVAETFLKQHTRDGRNVFLAEKRFGYLLMETQADGRVCPLLTIRRGDRPSWQMRCLTYAFWGVVGILFVVLYAGSHAIDRALGIDETLRKHKRLFNSF
jgi:hypothetical protein